MESFLVNGSVVDVRRVVTRNFSVVTRVRSVVVILSVVNTVVRGRSVVVLVVVIGRGVDVLFSDSDGLKY